VFVRQDIQFDGHMGLHLLLDNLYPDKHSKQVAEDVHFLQPEPHLLQVKVLVKKNSVVHVVHLVLLKQFMQFEGQIRLHLLFTS